MREFSRLPGIGPRSAYRLAFHVLKLPEAEVEKLSAALLDVKKNIGKCPVCGGISDGEICSICGDENRDGTLVCVVEEARDVLAIESAGGFKGKYHVLDGLISPLDGRGPEHLNMASLPERCSSEHIRELVIALNPTIEGDATTLHIQKIVKDRNVSVTRIARGLPMGSDIEFADRATINKSFEGRVALRDDE